jgi:predicted transposase/invertase (TIGR01784 family)
VLEEKELSSDLEKWLYILKNMSRLKKIPIFLRKPIFQQVFQIAEMSALTKEERMLYDASLKAKRDWNNTVAWAAEEAAKLAAEQARKEERVKAAEEKYAMQIESAIEMKKDRLAVAQIAKFTKLPLEVIEKL